MKKIFYVCVYVAALFLSSCSDMAPSSAEKYDLPPDFDYQVYAKINKDVAMSQIYFAVLADSTNKTAANCKNLLQNQDFAKKIYLDYVFCPEYGWPADSISPMGSWGACWNDGWNDLAVFFQDSLTKYTGTPRSKVKVDTTIKMMCMFVPKAENVEKAESYLKDFYSSANGEITAYGQKFSSELAIQQYFFIGRYDGRPYKYCKGQRGAEKTEALADKRGTFYDYGKYTFCLEETDKKIYVAQ